MATPQDRYIKIGNIDTRYWAEGRGGQAVILIHGLGASADIWMHNISALAERYRVYAPDLVGFGHTDKPEAAYSPSYITGFLDDFVRALGIKYPNLIGLSLGGGVALQYALQFPGRVERLVLVDSAGLGREMPLPMRLATIPLLGELMLTPTRAGMAFVLRHLVYDPSVITDTLIDLYCELNFRRGASKTILSVLRACATVGGVRAEVIEPLLKNLGRITIPTMVIWGRDDSLFPVGHACFAVEKIPDSRLYVFDRCGHMPNLERPEEFNSLVQKFLDGHALHS